MLGAVVADCVHGSTLSAHFHNRSTCATAQHLGVWSIFVSAIKNPRSTRCQSGLSGLCGTPPPHACRVPARQFCAVCVWQAKWQSKCQATQAVSSSCSPDAGFFMQQSCRPLRRHREGVAAARVPGNVPQRNALQCVSLNGRWFRALGGVVLVGHGLGHQQALSSQFAVRGTSGLY